MIDLQLKYLDIIRSSSSFTFRDRYVARNPHPPFATVVCLGSLEDQADEIIQREKEVFRQLDREFEWCVFSSDEPVDLVQKLEAHGFLIKPKEVICMAGLDQFAIKADSHHVEIVRTEKHLQDFRFVAEEVFKKDFQLTTGILAKGIEINSTLETGFVAYEGEQPVSIGRLFRREGAELGSFYTGATREGFRGKGHYQSVIAKRIEFARQLGIRYVSVDALPTSLPILKRLGFTPILESWPCVWSPR